MDHKVQGAWSRRGFLRAGFLGGIAAGFVGLSVGLQPTRRRPRQGQVSVFDDDEFAILCAIADRVCPPAGPGSPGALALSVPEAMAALLAQAPPDAQQEVRTALWIVESPLLGLLSGERYRPFTQLSTEGQDAVLRSFRDSVVPVKRAIYAALRGAVASLCYGDERMWRQVGYGGPPNRQALRAAVPDLLVDYESLRGVGS